MSDGLCVRCAAFPKVKGERYCALCRKKVLAEMKASGYLTPLPWMGRNRGTEYKENIRETKYGIDY